LRAGKNKLNCVKKTIIFKALIFVFLFFFILFDISAINFQDINLSNDNRLIYRANFFDSHAIFVSHLANQTNTGFPTRQLTAFPEKLYLVDNGRTIIALNRFGAVRIPTAGGLPSALPGYPSFTGGSLPLAGRLQDLAASPDGRWIIFIEPTSAGYGNLILVDINSGTRQLITERIELPASYFPAKWSPDSQYFIYSKGLRLFYFPINHSITGQVDERFRMIGTGRINSIFWGQHGGFFYLTGNTLYHVRSPEIFTRTMFGDFLSIGNVAAVLPFDFDSGFDNFWVAPDVGSFVVKKRQRGLFLFMLGDNHNSSVSMPHISIPYGAENFNVLWSAAGDRSILTVLFSLNDQTTAWRFEITARQGTSPSIRTTEMANTPSSAAGSLSPDGTRAIFWGERGLELWNYTSWQLISRLNETPVFSGLWVNPRQIIIGNSRFIEEINVQVSSFPRRIISLSGADEIGFEENIQTGFTRTPSRILARVGTAWFATDGSGAWTAENNVRLRPVSVESERFRVFLEPQNQGPFRNIPLLRDLQSFTTISFFPLNFTGRSSVGAALGATQRIAIYFDLYDDDTGLALVLAALRRHGKRATFFLNGEFIRRNPQAARAIANAGHETASMFFAPIDFSDTRFQITEDFIIQGLARNEDEFFRVTGRELSAIWRPPFYRSSPAINAAAARAGYFTVERSFDPGDWLSAEDALRLNLRQVPPSEMIDQIMERITPGALIPIRLGLLPGGRDSYLFQYIDVLFDALIRAGFELMPVSAVIR